ncbi:MAG TPA: hydrogenase small subunit [Thermoanaerobaculia bacterium]|nr:hydrogenase small subunit [Thermoanaerobaculia bacterium]
MAEARSWFDAELERRGVSRREFVRYCGVMAAALALPRSAAGKIAAAIQRTEKPVLVWLEFQDCAGNTESLLRASHPSVADIVLDTLSVDYQETIMAAAGFQAEENLARVVKDKKGAYLVAVEGSIPTGIGGAYCTIAGRSALEMAREVCGGAAATIAIGSCAAFGGLPAAAPNPTGALGVADAVPGLKNLINLPACPMNVENLTALIVYYLTFKDLPALDDYRRPLFAYGKTIHDNCERRAHFDAGQYVEAWGDEAHRSGYCLYKMGCKGPVSYQNCPVTRWNEGTNWPIGCGHPCIGCAEPDFWDKMTPFYRHLPAVPGFGLGTNIDKIGLGASAGVAAAFGTHGIISLLRRARGGRLKAEHIPPPPPVPEGDEPARDEKKGASS